MASNHRRGEFNECVQLLCRENGPVVFWESAEMLIKIATNIINNPKNEKFHKLRLENQNIKKNLLTVCGALECLLEMGFEMEDEFLVFPEGRSTDSLIKICNQLKVKIGMRQKPEKVQIASPIRIPPRPGQPLPREGPLDIRELPNGNIDMERTESQMYNRFERNMAHVLMYENLRLQRKARELIPMDEFTRRPEFPPSEDVPEDGNPNNPDMILLKLLHWFNKSFFTWVDNLPCEVCGSKNTNKVGNARLSDEDYLWMAEVTELYKCADCGSASRFPRYNHPEKLLRTRKGRCGEWANCFTLMCRAIGFEARFILDLTDHVWTEVYSTVQDRWLHCDPCENVCDQPLMYEVGWKKKLNYVFAFSVKDVMDVTWRYTKDHTATLRNRNLCRESWLINIIKCFNKDIQAKMTRAQVKEQNVRYVRELVEFSAPVNAIGQYGGRISGSLEWRILRGEAGIDRANAPQQDPHVFKLTETEKEAKKFHLRYDSSRDVYIRLSNNDEVSQGFESWLVYQRGMFRKVENDWGMAYLTRKESEIKGSLCWSFDFKDTNLCFKSINLRLRGTTFHSGKVEAKMLIDTKVIPISTNADNVLVEGIEFENKFMLCAEVSGGEGNCAWQHAQLFRQKLNEEDYSFEIFIDFMKESTGDDANDDYSISE